MGFGVANRGRNSRQEMGSRGRGRFGGRGGGGGGRFQSRGAGGFGGRGESRSPRGGFRGGRGNSRGGNDRGGRGQRRFGRGGGDESGGRKRFFNKVDAEDQSDEESLAASMDEQEDSDLSANEGVAPMKQNKLKANKKKVVQAVDEDEDDSEVDDDEESDSDEEDDDLASDDSEAIEEQPSSKKAVKSPASAEKAKPQKSILSKPKAEQKNAKSKKVVIADDAEDSDEEDEELMSDDDDSDADDNSAEDEEVDGEDSDEEEDESEEEEVPVKKNATPVQQNGVHNKKAKKVSVESVEKPVVKPVVKPVEKPVEKQAEPKISPKKSPSKKKEQKSEETVVEPAQKSMKKTAESKKKSNAPLSDFLKPISLAEDCEPGTRIYVRSLPLTVEEKELRRLAPKATTFYYCGEQRNSQVGVAFTFTNKDDANAFLKKIHDMGQYDGKPIYARVFENMGPKGHGDSKDTIYVGNLPKEVSKESLSALFPENMSVTLLRRRKGTLNITFAFVRFNDAEIAQKYINSNEKIMLDGCQLRISKARERREENPADEGRLDLCTLYINNLPAGVKADVLKSLFPSAQRFVFFPTAGRFASSKSAYAYAFFNSEEDAAEALKANVFAKVGGRQLCITFKMAGKGGLETGGRQEIVGASQKRKASESEDAKVKKPKKTEEVAETMVEKEAEEVEEEDDDEEEADDDVEDESDDGDDDEDDDDDDDEE